MTRVRGFCLCRDLAACIIAIEPSSVLAILGTTSPTCLLRDSLQGVPGQSQPNSYEVERDNSARVFVHSSSSGDRPTFCSATIEL